MNNNTSEPSGINGEVSMEEGKYPERQAYKSEGWLVTFSSKEYRDSAIKRGTHSISDPTHGKGGMKMYTKKKEKEKQPVQTPAVSAKTPNMTQPPVQQQMKPIKSIGKPEQPDETEEDAGDDDYYSYEMQAKDDAYMVQKLGNRYRSKYIKQPGQDETPPISTPTATVQQKPEPQPTVAPTPPPATNYVEPSKKFAADKGWTQTSYGDWRDKEGTTVAITASSGEVVPINNAYRDELKMLSKKDTNAIEEIISDAALDSRISDGIVNLKNSEHIQVIAEVMYNRDIDVDIINEFVERFMEEGKHPDRQAYNKDGWLVTFPSAEYKKAALKKGTHYPSDPTHGKGGMNLYYKKRGKQKRQTQQVATATEPVNQSQKVAASNEQPAQKPQAPYATDVGNDQSSKSPNASGTTTSPVQSTKIEPVDVSSEKTSSEPTQSEPSPEKTPTSVEPMAPASIAPSATSYTALSVKFAASKGWKETPYGEYRDETGATSAVVGLSGEVVPIKNVDREEFKIFAEKNPM